MKVFFVFALAFVVAIQTANSTNQCFKCSDPMTKGSCKGDEADWEKNGWKKVDCSGGSWGSKITKVDGDDTTITRDCAWGTGSGTGLKNTCQGKADDGKGGEMCFCEGNLCNGSFKTQASVFGTIMLLIFFFTYFQLR